MNSIEEFLKELNGRKEQQRIEEEKAEKLRKIKAEQVLVSKLNNIPVTMFVVCHKSGYIIMCIATKSFYHYALFFCLEVK